jgi:hypothetical protein
MRIAGEVSNLAASTFPGRRRTFRAALATALAVGILAPPSVGARSVDVVPVSDLNFRFADCVPQQHTYDLKRHSTIYYGSSILCQVNLAYITYDRKYRYQSG